MASPQSRKTDSKLDVKIAYQPGQPDEPHTEIFSSPENVGTDAPEKSELIGEVKSEFLELASRFQQFHSTLRYPVKVEDFVFLTFRLTVDLTTADRT
jgi:hypothetical protein